MVSSSIAQLKRVAPWNNWLRRKLAVREFPLNKRVKITNVCVILAENEVIGKRQSGWEKLSCNVNFTFDAFTVNMVNFLPFVEFFSALVFPFLLLTINLTRRNRDK